VIGADGVEERTVAAGTRPSAIVNVRAREAQPEKSKSAIGTLLRMRLVRPQAASSRLAIDTQDSDSVSSAVTQSTLRRRHTSYSSSTGSLRQFAGFSNNPLTSQPTESLN
jgi:hypothetical protein